MLCDFDIRMREFLVIDVIENAARRGLSAPTNVILSERIGHKHTGSVKRVLKGLEKSKQLVIEKHPTAKGCRRFVFPCGKATGWTQKKAYRRQTVGAH